MSGEQKVLYAVTGTALLLAAVLAVLYVLGLRRQRKLSAHMQKVMNTYKEKTGNVGGVYERLYPKALLGLLGIRKLSEMTANVQKTFSASVLSVNALDYSKAIHTMASAALFETINTVFSGLIPLIHENGGMIDKFEKAGMNGLFVRDDEKALNAAISLCEFVNGMGDHDSYQGFSLGIDFGEVRLGIVGARERMSVVTMSECVSISELLQERAAKYGARILATGDYVHRVSGFEKKYNSRLLGYFYDTTGERAIKVYDIYDGDAPERKQSKRRTRMIFEQGVDRFIHGNYVDARLHFVEVLKTDRYDLAAREYLYLCDTFCRETQGPAEVCIEKF